MSMGDLTTGETRSAQFNPSELRETVQVTYARLVVLGFGDVPQYSHTESIPFEFDLFCRADTPDETRDAEELRKFLFSLCYPRRGAQSVRQGAPPRVMFVWPSLVSLQAYVEQVEVRHQFFKQTGAPRIFTAGIKLREVSDVRIFSDVVRRNGTQR